MRVATAMPQRRLLIHLSRSDSATKKRGNEDEERWKKRETAMPMQAPQVRLGFEAPAHSRELEAAGRIREGASAGLTSEGSQPQRSDTPPANRHAEI